MTHKTVFERILFWKNPIRLLPKKGKISARVIARSRHEKTGVDLITLELCYPLVIHQQFLTHRVFSRNSESMRAIPTAQVIQNAFDYFYFPDKWRKRTKGMSPQDMENKWHIAANIAMHYAGFYFQCFNAWVCSKFFNLAKEQANRKLHECLFIKTVASSTEWKDFFAQRLNPDTQSEMTELAFQIYNAIQSTDPEFLGVGRWHLPYCTSEEKAAAHAHGGWHLQRAIEASVARCGRISTANHGVDKGVDSEKKFYDRELNANPRHGSVFEHVAQACNPEDYIASNFKGCWNQYRKIMEDNHG